MKKLILKTPPAGITADSVVVMWDRERDVDFYDVYVNGEHDGSVCRGDSTIEGLEPEQLYDIYVCAVKNGVRCAEGSIEVKTGSNGKVLNIADFGAVGDGVTVNTEAIQRAIDACEENGTVLVPEGVFVSGAVYLKSNMTLYIEDKGELRGSIQPSDYPIKRYRWEGRERDCYSSLVNTDFDFKGRNKNIVIAGKGRINASGAALKKNEEAEGKACRGRAVCIVNTDGLYIKDVIIKQSPAWCVHPIYCTGVTLNNVKIYTRYDEERSKVYEGMINGDGFDPDSCKDVYVFNSMIASQDDCIAVKSGRDEEGRAVGIPSENIRITDCSFENGLAIAIGSEASGDVRNVLVRDCTCSHVYSVCSIKTPRGRGGVIENVVYENIDGEYSDDEFKDCEWFRGAIYVDHFYSLKEFDPNEEMPLNDGTPKIRNITLRNINVKSSVSNAVYLGGLPESPLENITLCNVNAEGRTGMKAYNVKGLTMDNVNIKSHEGAEYFMVNIEMND